MFKLQRSAATILAFVLLITQLALPASPASPGFGRVSPRSAARPDTITGTLLGLVVDSGGAPLQGVRIVLTNQDNGNQRATITNSEGRYQVTFLPLGIYSIEASKEGLVVIKPTNGPVKTALNRPVQTAPEIVMGPAGSALPNTTNPTNPTNPNTASTTPPSGSTPAATTSSQPVRDEVGQLTNSTDATRRANADDRQVATLPLGGVRTFDDFAQLAAGVALPPQVKGVAGPGIGAGIGTAGQFSVNGQRARANNFTVDGSDNNDEDVGVRRQGFVSLVPQSIESIREFQIVTQLWDAELGRNTGSQVNAVSRSGTNQFHGSLYDFFNHSALNARNFFDYTSDKSASYALTARAKAKFSGRATDDIVPVTIDGKAVTQLNPSADKDPFQRNQIGAALGFPLKRDKTFFFGSFEHQQIKARQETHFSVPTVAERGYLGSGASGLVTSDFFNRTNSDSPFPTYAAGDNVFALMPFPNNPIGPYGENTFTRVLPADAKGTIFSLKFDHSFTLFGPEVRHTLTGRYNFTDDRKQVPAVGGAIFSGLEPKVRTQNVSLFLNSQLTSNVSNQLRLSYGRTRLRFDAIRDSLQIPSQFVANDPLLLNRNVLFNFSSPGSKTANYLSTTDQADQQLGPVGQLLIAPYSAVGLDPYLFPQARTNNTYQYADTMTLFRGRHNYKFGIDLRRTQLNSFLNRNFRPQVVFSGTFDQFNVTKCGQPQCYFTGTDLASLGIPSGIFQSLSLGNPDSTIGLRFWQYNGFFNDTWRVRRGLTIDYGLRYEFNSVPSEVNSRIEKTFSSGLVPAADPNLRIVLPNTRTQLDNAALIAGFKATSSALDAIIAGRQTIFDPDRNNFGPHLGFAWDPWAGSRTQAGKTTIRGGFGMYYDVALGSVVSQSRNVFPTFIPLNLDANAFAVGGAQFDNGSAIFNPNFLIFQVVNSSTNTGGAASRLVNPGTVNTISTLQPGALQALLGLLLNPPANAISTDSNIPLTGGGGGLAFTLPDRKLRSPYALQYNLQVEHEIFTDFLVNLAYVGSRGIKLTRFRTPNGGQSGQTVPLDIFRSVSGIPTALALAPVTRTNTDLGAYTIFDSSAASTYHSMQLSVTKRFNKGSQLTWAYTWSHAIDDVSDVFDVAGAFNLPQDDRNLRAERGNANFDVRHRFVLSSLSNVPFISRFNNEKGFTGFVLGGWQMASISTYQTGQPFTLNTSFDTNLDGNLTDRLRTTSGIVLTERGPQSLALTVPAATLLAASRTNGTVGRNTFRARGIAKTDFSLIKNFRVRESNSLILRVEAFNLWNRTHFGIPVRILESPSFGNSVDTSVNPRQVQFALKYVF